MYCYFFFLAISSQIYNLLFMGCKYIYIYIYIIGERETKRKRGKKDGREERETKFFIFCDCVIYIILFY